MELQMPDIKFMAMLPIVIILVTAVAATILGFFTSRRNIAMLGITGQVLTLGSLFSLWDQNLSSFAGSLQLSNVSLIFAGIILIGSILSQLTSLDHTARSNLNFPEFDIILLYGVTGTLLIAFSGDLIVMLIGLEVMSLSTYVLATLQESRRSEEAGMKYFLLGSVASAVLIYGIALVFGATGTFSYDGIRQAIASQAFQNDALLLTGAFLLLAGFSFKVAMAPFHQWTPDVYSGSPTIVTQFMSIVVKTAAFAGMIAVFLRALPGADWTLPAQIILALTMIGGNMAALRQAEIKRALAYSAIAHSGYLGLALLAAPDLGIPALLYHLLGYTFANAGAFAVIAMLQQDDRGMLIPKMRGLYYRKPLHAISLAIFLLSLAGIPPFAGFVAKLVLFGAAFQSGYTAMTIIAIVTSMIAFVYYLRPAVLMFMPAEEPQSIEERSFPNSTLTVLASVAATVVLGVLPNWVLTLFNSPIVQQAMK
ncbi:NADH-quinone oxidoreductase subunit N [Deinococcus cellulosilyticus]|uniref:NADH-quinone oxidoreductase subunit N n=1 Tax=Deinococcus cellulosilyticus (strain DSM 18568 / NBRC 106333 / KACC 11606 / 5516J-15) TaxID=1223518 RepID=A0A511N6B9_DEIC1|nr:NADH-quinone oxidoreductase subunit N [Deinococcus cellulosilyticus]GEM47986.1 NADH-quinone oxidoreductase subunit N [Deinococcus cellulosilyticus NBRC 106333 = KACC 11606]